MRQKYFTIFSKTLANRLCKQGYILVETRIHDTQPWKYVYVFENSEELQEELNRYKEEKRNERG